MYTTTAEVRAAAQAVLDEANRTNDFRELPYQLRLVADNALASGLTEGEDEFPAELGGVLWAWDEGPWAAEWLAFKVAMALAR